MSRVRIKTDNSFLREKVELRIRNLPKKDKITVLDCFAGRGVIWSIIKSQVKDIDIQVVSIDLKDYGTNLKGDNRKYLLGMDLSKFDIVDLDAYGTPYEQLEVLFKKDYRGIIFITFAQIRYFGLPLGMLEQIGYPRSMVKKCPTLFYKDGFEKFLEYLAKKGIDRIIYIDRGNKKYCMIRR
jgi:hypothetical protein